MNPSDPSAHEPTALQQTALLLERVRRRWTFVGWARQTVWWLCGLASAGVVWVLVMRLTGVLPAIVPQPQVLVPLLTAWPVLASVLAVFTTKRPRGLDVARTVDQAAGQQDLFLTAFALLRSQAVRSDRPADDYRPVVAQTAEAAARTLTPARVVPWVWTRGLQRALAGSLALAGAFVAAVVWMPQFDPFGQQAQAAVTNQRLDRLQQTKKETAERRAELARKSEDASETAADEKVEELKDLLLDMQPEQKEKNRQELANSQKEIGQMWRKLNAERLKEGLSRKGSLDQQFGARENDDLKKAAEQLSETGSPEALQQELEKVAEALQRLAKEEDPVERAKTEQEVRDHLNDLQQMAKDQLGSKELAAALERAKKQLDLAKVAELAESATQAAKESVELAKAELKELAQSMEDLQQLESALKVLQDAKKLNESGELDGKECENCKSLADYEAIFKEAMADMNGEGELGGEGFGEGGAAPEDESVETDFKVERTPTQVQAGKVLLSMKTKGLNEKGEDTVQYQNAIRSVKQGVSEAIEQEQIPPGYHEAIKKYFDQLEASGPAPAGK